MQHLGRVFLGHHEAINMRACGRGDRRTVFDAVEGLLDGRALQRAAPQTVVDEVGYVLRALVRHLQQCKCCQLRRIAGRPGFVSHKPLNSSGDGVPLPSGGHTAEEG